MEKIFVRRICERRFYDWSVKLLDWINAISGNSQNQSNPATTGSAGPSQQQQQQQTQQQQQAGAAQNGGQADYSVQWAEYYRSIGKIKEAEAIEAQMKAGKVFSLKYNAYAFFVVCHFSIMWYYVARTARKPNGSTTNADSAGAVGWPTGYHAQCISSNLRKLSNDECRFCARWLLSSECWI